MILLRVAEPTAGRVQQQVGVFGQVQQARAEQGPSSGSHKNQLPAGVADAVGGTSAQVDVGAVYWGLGQLLAEQTHGGLRPIRREIAWSGDGTEPRPRIKAGG